MLLWVGCGPHRVAKPSPEDGLCPSPYSATQLRDALPVGTRLRYRIQVPASPVVYAVLEFVASDMDEGSYRRNLQAEDGSAVTEATVQKVPWEVLDRNMRFPADQTRIERVRITTDLGEVDCLLYTVQARDEGGGARVERYWYALRPPGPPARMTVEVAGVEVERRDLVERVGPSAGPSAL